MLCEFRCKVDINRCVLFPVLFHYGCHRILETVPCVYSRSSFLIHPVDDSPRRKLPDSQSIAPRLSRPLQPQVCSCVCDSVYVSWTGALVWDVRPHVHVTWDVCFFGTHFTSHGHLQIHPCCCKWHIPTVFMAEKCSLIFLGRSFICLTLMDT